MKELEFESGEILVIRPAIKSNAAGLIQYIEDLC
jgi:hypothetical protein